MSHQDQPAGDQIAPWTQGYKLWSPDRRYYATYAGSEFGMGSPTLGQISLKSAADGRPVYTSPSWAQACFSDDSRYFIHALASGDGGAGYRATVVIDCQTGEEQWIEEKSAGESVELRNADLVFSICGVSITTLEGLSFNISRSVLEKTD